ncbi:NAD(P)H-quinone oxidoreductase subunit 5 [Phormidesmis sp. 146-12]
MELLYQYVWLIPVLPLAGAALIGLGLITFNKTTNRLRRESAVFIMSLVGAAMLMSMSLLWSQIQGHASYIDGFEWATAGSFHLRIGYTIDHLAAMMLTIVTTVAFLVMIYTDGYMAHDPSYVRFYVYLSLFSSSMLGLVISPNLVQIYIFWELVGMCSYLLIGFWYERKAAAAASQKAFVTNRVGDFGLLLGILALYWTTGSFEFEVISDRLQALIQSGSLSVGLASLFAILVFLGPVAKSAQFPLHVWLPDAMEGPTPISALIHAATMVAAGVFLVARMFPVFEGLPAAMNVIAWTGAFTAFLGATIAITQNDIKKGLAYSTMSQLGYMIMAMGVGAYSAGLFHLMTHAYFKAMLFLGSGSVIHGMESVVGHDPALAQDMRLMGGLRKYMPVTATTFLIGTLAIAGIPPFAGFWSKDEILGAAFAANPILWAIGWLTAGITAFYMFRMYLSTFEGEFRGHNYAIRQQLQTKKLQQSAESPDQHNNHREYPHESPLAMVLPLVILAIPSQLIGLVGTPFANYFKAFLNSSDQALPALIERMNVFDLNEFLLIAGTSVAIALLGIILALLMYLKHEIDPGAIAHRIRPLYLLSLHKWYIDDLYDVVFVQSSRRLAQQVREVDRTVVDGFVNLTGLVTLVLGEGLKYLESGRAQLYVLLVFGTVLGLVLLSSVS